MEVVSIKNLDKVYKRYKYKNKRFSLFNKEVEKIKALDNLNLKINKGDLMAYVGINGAGKSTSIKLLSGILSPTKGEVRVLGLDPFKSRRKLAQKYCVIFGQRSQLWWDIPPVKTYELLKEIYNISDKKYRKNLDMFIEILDMKSIINTPVRNLSLGQRMRAEFAAAFLHDPEIALLDEATIGLDVIAKERIRNFLKEMNKEKKITILLASHDLSDVEQLCSKIIMVDSGKKIYDGNIEGIKAKYQEQRFILVECDNTNLNINNSNIKLENSEDNLFTVSFNINDISQVDVINHLINNNSIKDFHIKEPDLEYIVKKVYKNGH